MPFSFSLLGSKFTMLDYSIEEYGFMHNNKNQFHSRKVKGVTKERQYAKKSILKTEHTFSARLKEMC